MKLQSVFTRLAGTGLIAALVAAAVAPAAHAEPERGAKSRRSGFDLLGAGSTWTAVTNRVQCGLNNLGEVCVDTFGSPTGGGGFWPAGSPNQYIFNSGLQIAGIIAADAPIWAGDTVGAYIFDARGTQQQGQSVSLVYSSVNPDDVANWPAGAYIRDADLYNAALLGRKSISQEDTWVRYWDGPGLLSGRRHPMGILVEQRGLAWNYPSGNQDILYFLYTFFNISASDPAAYSNLDPAIRGEVAAIAADWVSQTESRLGTDIPSQGYRIDSVFAAFAMDPDVGDAGSNSSTAILPFSMGLAYKSDFNEPTWLFPPDINGPPFGPYPGFVGVKYLKSPIVPGSDPPEQVGLTMFSNTTNPSAANSLFPDPTGVSQLWRYLSGRIDPSQGDPPCQINPPIERRICALVQAPTDTRFYQASGPFSLNPGESSTIVVAYVHAAPIGAVVAPYYNGTLAPGIPPSGTEIANDPSVLRPIELAAGWNGQNDANGDGAIQQNEVVTVPRSLLQKSLVAQSLFDVQFLLPFAPEAPDFFLVPGNNAVTVVWQPSVTEQIGDPYFAIAADPSPSNGLYDPNYREFDVEGYRIYRGRTRAQMELIAQYDYSGTTFVDYTGVWAYQGRCAPELGIEADCPSFPDAHDLVGDISQVTPGGRVELAGGQYIVIPSEEVGTTDGTLSPALSDLEKTPVAPSSVYLKIKLSPTDSLLAHDNGLGGFTGDATGTIDYLTGAITATWAEVAPEAEPIIASYGYTNAAGEGEVLITSKVNPLEDAGFPALRNSGVPFAYVDNAVVNSVNYYYAVTAFDVNSVASGPGTLESPLASKEVTPRSPAANTLSAQWDLLIAGDDGEPLDPSAPYPAIDPDNGTFNGNVPPVNTGSIDFLAVVEEALPLGDASVQVDSVGNGWAGGFGDAPPIYFSLSAGGQTFTMMVNSEHIPQYNSGTPDTYTLERALVPYDAEAAARLGIQFTQDVRMPIQFTGTMVPMAFTSPGVATASGRYGVSGFGTSRYLGHSRWFDEGGTEPADPTIVGVADSAHNSGTLTGVGRIWAPSAYRQSSSQISVNFRGQAASGFTAWYPADFVVTWNGDHSVTVRDVTHNVTLPPAGSGGSGVGFVTLTNILATGLDAATFDGAVADGVGSPVYNIVNYNHLYMTQPTCTDTWWEIPDLCIELSNTAELEPLDFNTDGVADGDGIVMWVNGEIFFMEMNQLPAAGTEWHLRAIAGEMSATCTPSLGPVMTDCSSYTFAPTSMQGSVVPGLRYVIRVNQGAAIDVASSGDLSRIHTVPDPYYVTSGLEVTPSQKVLKFVNLPAQAIIRIYSLSGVLVDVVEHNDPRGGGEATWQVRNRNQQFVASGVYFYHVETPTGEQKIGRFTVVNSKGIAVGQSNQ